MSVVRYEPWDLMEKFHRDVNRLFTTASARRATEDGSAAATSQWTPAVDIQEESDKFVIHADIPGVDPKDIEITLDRGVLSIAGLRKAAADNETCAYARLERSYGSFYRRFTLPDVADAENVEASGNNGVLEITIPKRTQAQPKRISVN
ncbi:MAG: Hsp20/alpha crystallin family protein [Gammaproteobacteria bacterium]